MVCPFILWLGVFIYKDPNGWGWEYIIQSLNLMSTVMKDDKEVSREIDMTIYMGGRVG